MKKMPKDFEVLTPRQRAFGIAMFTLSDPSIVDCVRAAGYSLNGNTPHAQGQKLMQNPNVRAAMQAEMFRRAEAGGPTALRHIQEMAFTRGHRDQYGRLLKRATQCRSPSHTGVPSHSSTMKART
jgi:phage terminase small subunit